MENRFDEYKMRVFIKTHNRKRRKDQFHKRIWKEKLYPKNEESGIKIPLSHKVSKISLHAIKSFFVQASADILSNFLIKGIMLFLAKSAHVYTENVCFLLYHE